MDLSALEQYVDRIVDRIDELEEKVENIEKEYCDMKAITELTLNEIEYYQRIRKNLDSKVSGVKMDELLANFTKVPSYAKYEFAGEITDRFVELLGRMPTEEEVIILVDRGFSHFGAMCTITERFVRGRVYYD